MLFLDESFPFLQWIRYKVDFPSLRGLKWGEVIKTGWIPPFVCQLSPVPKFFYLTLTTSVSSLIPRSSSVFFFFFFDIVVSLWTFLVSGLYVRIIFWLWISILISYQGKETWNGGVVVLKSYYYHLMSTLVTFCVWVRLLLVNPFGFLLSSFFVPVVSLVFGDHRIDIVCNLYQVEDQSNCI